MTEWEKGGFAAPSALRAENSDPKGRNLYLPCARGGGPPQGGGEVAHAANRDGISEGEQYTHFALNFFEDFKNRPFKLKEIIVSMCFKLPNNAYSLMVNFIV